VALIAAVVACVMRPDPATLPVTLPVRLPIKPFVDVTGPEKVVDAIIFPYIQVKCASLYVVSRDCLAHRKARIAVFISRYF